MKIFKQLSFLIALNILIIFTQNCAPSGFQTFDPFALDLSSSSLTPDLTASTKLYAMKCAGCHGDLSISAIKDKSKEQITTALNQVSTMSYLRGTISAKEIEGLAAVLSTKAPIASCEATGPEFVNVQRLSRLEYNNVIRDLVGLDLNVASIFPEDARGMNFSNTALALTIDPTQGDKYMDAAITVLDQAFSRARANIITCDPNSLGHRMCAEKVIKEFGQKAFRRPLEAAEINGFLKIYDQVRAVFPANAGANVSQFDESLKAPLQAMLISPKFLFRIFDATNVASIRNLAPYELASRLSFFIWGSIPDQTLLNLAANGSLTNPQVLTQQVDRMLKDSKSAYMVDAFAFQWLRIDSLKTTLKSSMVYPEYNDSLKASMLNESRMFIQDMIQKDISPYHLLEGNYSYIDPALAKLYGTTVTGTGFQKVDLTNSHRRGVLGHASLLSVNAHDSESSIVKRGLFILSTMMCINPGSPPPLADEEVPRPEELENLNPRERLAAHTKNPKCASCHNHIDPPGIALENFDGIGKWRASYSNQDPVDSRSQFSTGEPATSLVDVAQYLGKSDQYRSCFSSKLMSFALGRDLLEADRCTVQKSIAEKVQRGQKFSDVVKAIVLSPQFLQHKGSP